MTYTVYVTLVCTFSSHLVLLLNRFAEGMIHCGIYSLQLNVTGSILFKISPNNCEKHGFTVNMYRNEFASYVHVINSHFVKNLISKGQYHHNQNRLSQGIHVQSMS